MSTESPVKSDRGAPVRVLTLTSPGTRNALSKALMAALKAEIEAAGANEAVRAIILAAEGPVFCAGHNLKEINASREEPDGGEATYRSLFQECSELMLAILRCPVPVIAQVQGMATAAGCQLVATCDLAVAAEGAKFATPGVNIGLFCSTPMVPLSRNVPRKAAMEMLLTGAPIDAAAAERLGLINRVVKAGALESETRKLADHIASKAGRVLRIGKEAFYHQLELGISDAYAYATDVMTQNVLADDAEEGIKAFVEKRDPKWSDH